jgi:hypothetical protein
MFTGIIKKATHLIRYSIPLALLAGICIINTGCAKKPSGSFSQILTKAGIEMGKPFVASPGMQVKEKTIPGFDKVPAQKAIVLRNAAIGLGSDNNVVRAFISNPEHPNPENASLSPLDLRTTDGASLFKLSEADIKRLFGKPSRASKDAQAAGANIGSTFTYEYVTSDKQVITVTYLFTDDPAAATVDMVMINLITLDFMRKNILESGKEKVYDW